MPNDITKCRFAPFRYIGPRVKPAAMHLWLSATSHISRFSKSLRQVQALGLMDFVNPRPVICNPMEEISPPHHAAGKGSEVVIGNFYTTVGIANFRLFIKQEGKHMKKIGIICAGDEELKPFLPHIENIVITEKAMLKFYEGKLNSVLIIALYSGVCKVNAAIATQILIDTYCVDSIINAGTAGGMDKNINLFDTVISTQVAYHDVDDGILTEFHPWMPTVYFDADEELLNIAKIISDKNKKVHLGRMVTGEKFIEDNKRDSINRKYLPLSVDMETASIAHVCYVNMIPFISIRSITDTATHSGIESFEKNCEKASVISKDIVLDFLKLLSDSHD